MCTFYKRYLSLCADWGESPSGVADKLGISRSAVTKWKRGGNPTDGNLQRIASFFGVSIEWLRDGTEPKKDTPTKLTIPPGFSPMPKMVKRPLVGRIAVRCDFCLECDGDSMIDVGIHSGDVVYIRIQPEVENGEIAAVRIGEEATLKKVYYDGESLILMPCNSVYQPKTYSGSALADIKIEGKAVGFTHWF